MFNEEKTARKHVDTHWEDTGVLLTHTYFLMSEIFIILN